MKSEEAIKSFAVFKFLAILIEFMLVVSTQTNKVEVVEDGQEDALAKMDLLNNPDSKPALRHYF